MMADSSDILLDVSTGISNERAVISENANSIFNLSYFGTS